MKCLLEKICWTVKKFEAILSGAKHIPGFQRTIKLKNTTVRDKQKQRCSRLTKHTRFFDSNSILHSPKPVNVTPHWKQAAIVQKPETVSSTPPPILNPKFLTPDPQIRTWPYLNKIPPHFIHEIKTKGYDIIGVNVFLHNLWDSFAKKGLTGPYTTTLSLYLFIRYVNGHNINIWYNT